MRVDRAFIGTALAIAAFASVACTPALPIAPQLDPARARPGTLSSVTPVGGYPGWLLRALIWSQGLAAAMPTQYGVSLYRVEYWTTAPDGRLVRASGLVAFPRAPTLRGVVSFQHGTATERTAATSAPSRSARWTTRVQSWPPSRSCAPGSTNSQWPRRADSRCVRRIPTGTRVRSARAGVDLPVQAIHEHAQVFLDRAMGVLQGIDVGEPDAGIAPIEPVGVGVGGRGARAQSGALEHGHRTPHVRGAGDEQDRSVDAARLEQLPGVDGVLVGGAALAFEQDRVAPHAPLDEQIRGRLRGRLDGSAAGVASARRDDEGRLPGAG